MTELPLFTEIRKILALLDQKDTATEKWDLLANTAIETGGQTIEDLSQGNWTADSALYISIFNVFAQGEDKADVVQNWIKTAHRMLEIAGTSLPTVDSGPSPICAAQVLQ